VLIGLSGPAVSVALGGIVFVRAGRDASGTSTK
jgi:hypothetical protein